jgi:hypothetical protein
MPLLDPNKFPPRGFSYFEPSINWRPPKLGLSLGAVAKQLQVARAQNPFAGLDPSFEACWEAVESYTCARLHNDLRWCAATPEQAAQIKEARKVTGCAGCGKRKTLK